jgi:hypothetical protein
MPKRNSPAPYIIKLTPLANAVLKDALDTTTPVIGGSAETSKSEAMAKPIGIIITAGDVLEINA